MWAFVPSCGDEGVCGEAGDSEGSRSRLLRPVAHASWVESALLLLLLFAIGVCGCSTANLLLAGVGGVGCGAKVALAFCGCRVASFVDTWLGFSRASLRISRDGFGLRRNFLTSLSISSPVLALDCGMSAAKCCAP